MVITPELEVGGGASLGKGAMGGALGGGREGLGDEGDEGGLGAGGATISQMQRCLAARQSSLCQPESPPRPITAQPLAGSIPSAQARKSEVPSGCESHHQTPDPASAAQPLPMEQSGST